MSHFTAVLDANVLHSYPLTALLLELAEARLYRPAWSQDIHTEWQRSVLRARPDVDASMLERRRTAMDTALPDACVSGYSRLIDALTLPDPDDRHVLAAAIRAKAEVIVTFNERDFPADTLAGFDITAQHPDVFLCHLIDLSPATVRARIEAMLRNWRKPPNTPEDFISVLERAGLPESAAALRELFAAA
ncbi:MAG: PIN domain-containing protein [Leptothrix sp. (in: b-proteobacteria)]